jgi:hypothetical protein
MGVRLGFLVMIYNFDRKITFTGKLWLLGSNGKVPECLPSKFKNEYREKTKKNIERNSQSLIQKEFSSLDDL